MAYAFNNIDDLVGNNPQGSGNIFGGGTEGEAGQPVASGGSSGGGAAIGGGGQQQSTTFSTPKSVQAPGGAVEAAYAQSQKSGSTGAESKYLAAPSSDLSKSVEGAQSEADKYVSGSKSGPQSLTGDELSGLSSDSAAFKKASGYLNPTLSNSSFNVSDAEQERLNKARTKIDDLGTAQGLGESILGDSEGGEFSRKLSKNVARGSLATDAYKGALKAAQEKAASAQKSFETIDSDAEAQGGAGREASMRAQKAATQKQLEDYRSGLISQGQGGAQSALSGAGSQVDPWGRAQGNAALQMYLRDANAQERADLANFNFNPSSFVDVNRPANLDWQQFVNPGQMENVSNIEMLLGMGRSAPGTAYAGPESMYSFNQGGFDQRIKDHLTQSQAARQQVQAKAQAAQPVQSGSLNISTQGGLMPDMSQRFAPNTNPLLNLDPKAPGRAGGLLLGL